MLISEIKRIKKKIIKNSTNIMVQSGSIHLFVEVDVFKLEDIWLHSEDAVAPIAFNSSPIHAACIPSPRPGPSGEVVSIPRPIKARESQDQISKPNK
jgi:hypothetical protein